LNFWQKKALIDCSISANMVKSPGEGFEPSTNRLTVKRKSTIYNNPQLIATGKLKTYESTKAVDSYEIL